MRGGSGAAFAPVRRDRPAGPWSAPPVRPASRPASRAAARSGSTLRFNAGRGRAAASRGCAAAGRPACPGNRPSAAQRPGEAESPGHRHPPPPRTLCPEVSRPPGPPRCGFALPPRIPPRTPDPQARVWLDCRGHRADRTGCTGSRLRPGFAPGRSADPGGPSARCGGRPPTGKARLTRPGAPDRRSAHPEPGRPAPTGRLRSARGAARRAWRHR